MLKVGDRVQLVKDNNYSITQIGWKGTIIEFEMSEEKVRIEWDEYPVKSHPLSVNTRDVRLLHRTLNDLVTK